MGVCREVDFRGYLSRLVQADLKNLKEAFNCVKKANLPHLLFLIGRFPGLLSQATKESHEANIVIAILHQISKGFSFQSSSLDPRTLLLSMLEQIIIQHKDKLDLRFSDKNGNTAFHFVFRYAIEIKDKDISERLTNVGCNFIGLLKDTQEFTNIVTIRNKDNKSFMDNMNELIAQKKKLKKFQAKNLDYVLLKLRPLLEPQITPPPVEVPQPIDNLSFVHERPRLGLGPTIKPKENEQQLSIDMSPVQAQQITVNLCVEQEHLPSEESTQQLPLATPPANDLTVDQSNQANQTVILNVLDTLVSNIKERKNGRAPWFTDNIDNKIGKFQVISDWLKDNNNIDELDEKLVLALIRSVCALKRNNLGFFQPHSLTEFDQMIENSKELKCPSNVCITWKDLEKMENSASVATLIAALKNREDQFHWTLDKPKSSHYLIRP
jgi:hypothetical protein